MRGYILNTPKLQRLCMRDLEITQGPSYFPLLFKSLINLTHLDMSGCDHRGGMDQFKWLPKYLKNTLAYLVLHNVREIDKKAIQNIIKLKKLKHLDISKVPDNTDFFKYADPNAILKLIVEGLPELSSLDISATNLAGNGVFEYNQNMNGDVHRREQRERNEDNFESESISSSDQESESNEMDADVENNLNDRGEMPKCDIVGLISRVKCPLDFLGLYKCIHEPCSRVHIPAREVSSFKLKASQICKIRCIMSNS